MSATAANEGLQGTNLFRDTSESRKLKQQMRNVETSSLASETEEEPDEELLPIIPVKRPLGKPFAMLQRQERLRDDRDLPEVHKSKRTRMEDVGGLRGFTE